VEEAVSIFFVEPLLLLERGMDFVGGGLLIDDGFALEDYLRGLMAGSTASVGLGGGRLMVVAGLSGAGGFGATLSLLLLYI
jgi:hypothetical protein